MTLSGFGVLPVVRGRYSLSLSWPTAAYVSLLIVAAEHQHTTVRTARFARTAITKLQALRSRQYGRQSPTIHRSRATGASKRNATSMVEGTPGRASQFPERFRGWSSRRRQCSARGPFGLLRRRPHRLGVNPSTSRQAHVSSGRCVGPFLWSVRSANWAFAWRSLDMEGLMYFAKFVASSPFSSYVMLNLVSSVVEDVDCSSIRSSSHLCVLVPGRSALSALSRQQRVGRWVQWSSALPSNR